MKSLRFPRIGSEWQPTLRTWHAAANSTEFLTDEDFVLERIEVTNPTITTLSTSGTAITPTFSQLRVGFSEGKIVGDLFFFKLLLTYEMTWAEGGPDDVWALNFELPYRAIFNKNPPITTQTSFPSGVTSSSNPAEYANFMCAPVRYRLISQASLGPPVTLNGPNHQIGAMDCLPYGNYQPDATKSFRFINYNGGVFGTRPDAEGLKSWIIACCYGFYEVE